MGLNNIQLPAQTIVDLYKNLLCEDSAALRADKVQIVEQKPIKKDVVEPKQLPEQISFLGKNLAQMVILVDYKTDVYLPENQLTFIGNILKACKMNLADVAIVNINKQQITIGELARQLNPKYLIILGIDAKVINFNDQSTLFNIITNNGVQTFSSPSLDELNQEGEAGKLLKSKLWLCMQKMLNL